MCRVAITGGRDHTPTRACIFAYLNLLGDLGATHLAHGASGAIDWGMSAVAAYTFPRLTVTPYPVLVTLDGAWPAAGPRRNRRMLRSSESEHLIRFPGNRGTADCTAAAGDLGLTRWAYDDAAGMWLPLPSTP